MFQLQTMLTTKCNYNCRYCYAKVNKKGNHESDMTLDDFVKMEEFLPVIQNEMHYVSYLTPNYEIAFFGGEPLLCLDNLLDIAQYAKSKYPNVLCTVPTNGSLLDEIAESRLADANVHYSVSYDGPYSNQRLNSKSPSPFLVSLVQIHGSKVMVNPDNVSSLFDNFLYFAKNGVPFSGISIVRDNIWNKTSLSILCKNLDRMYDYIVKSLKEKNELYLPQIFSLPILDTLIATKEGSRRKTGCFSGSSGLAFFADGDIYPCARFGTNKRFKLGNYKKKRLNKNNISFVLRASDILALEECKECPLYRVCNTGCFYSQLSFGMWKRNRPVINVCKAFKIIYDYSYRLYKEIGEFDEYKRYLVHHLKNLWS